jgi:glucose/arabinose dehydrogenase
MISYRALLVLTSVLFAHCVFASSATNEVLRNVRVPAGFKFEVYADNVPAAREMAMGARNTLFVGTSKDKVYAVSGTPGSGLTPSVRVIAESLNVPNGVAFRDHALYVAEIHRILRFDDIESNLEHVAAPKVVRDDMPKDRHHGMRYIAFGPDGKLYVPIGAPCNVCNEPKYGLITRMNPDGSGQEVFARGVRNSVGMTWDPTTQELWFTDNGRDYLGENSPPCELNSAPRPSLDFGFPYCHGGIIKDPDFGNLGTCAASTPPVQRLGAHVAPLGVKFYTGTMFPRRYRNQVLIAEHGSWNRKEKNGYRVTMVQLDANKAKRYELFVTGFNREDDIYGRPVDLLVLDDGSLLISDDYAGAIYRVSYVPAH